MRHGHAQPRQEPSLSRLQLAADALISAATDMQIAATAEPITATELQITAIAQPITEPRQPTAASNLQCAAPAQPITAIDLQSADRVLLPIPTPLEPVAPADERVPSQLPRVSAGEAPAHARP